MYNLIKVITVVRVICFAIHTFFVVTVDRAWETSHIYLTVIRNIIGMVHFIDTNSKFKVYVDRSNASNTFFTKSDFN